MTHDIEEVEEIPTAADILKEKIRLAEHYLPTLDPDSMEYEVTRRSIEEWRAAGLRMEVPF